ncbi:putative membrane protein [Leucobacter luti]|uniref:PH domain-containing protein n=1 Tax=Leucobacter luti TaxID=340320 RepID=UPI0010DBD6C5|nr:PH domain-containing protein [Leucobacter luti]MCW2287163.1 putative membrane protein [Leucobacter luti]TCK41389.1 putative membrane protein [Leucobacter luti]
MSEHHEPERGAVDPAAADPAAAAAATVAPAAALPGTADADGWRRMHPLSPLLRGGLALVVVAGIIIANFRDRFVEFFFADRFFGEDSSSELMSEPDAIDYIFERGLLLVVLGGILAIVLVIVVFSWVSWRFTTYRLGSEAVEARNGVLFRNHRRAPLERIQSVNLQRPMLARALGLTKIQVVTGGQGGTVELAYLGHRDAKTVREQILRRAAEKRRGDEAAALPITEIQAPGAVGYDGYVHAPDTAGLAGRAQEFADSDVDPEAIAANALVKVPVGRLVGSIALSWEAVSLVIVVVVLVVGGAIIEPAIIIAVIPMLIVMAGIMIGQFNKGFNFMLSRGRDTVRTGAGLTSTMTETIPFGRIHAVVAQQPLFWRPLGWWKVRITTAGHSAAQAGQNASQNVVLPVGTEADVLRVIDTLLPGLGDDEAEIAGLRDGLTGPATGYLRAGRRSGWVLWLGRRRAGLKIEGLGSEDATLRIRRGVMTRTLSIMPIVRTQSVQLRRPLVHRMLGLASIQAHTLLGPVQMTMRGLDLGSARAAFDALSAAVLRIQGAEAARLARAHAVAMAAPAVRETAGVAEPPAVADAVSPAVADAAVEAHVAAVEAHVDAAPPSSPGRHAE